MEKLGLGNNPYFTAGFGLASLGAALAGCRKLMIQAINILQRRHTTTVEFTSRDISYDWIVRWLSTRSLTSGHHYTAHASLGKNKDPFCLVPSQGTHYLRWNGDWIRIDRNRLVTGVSSGEKSISSFSGGPLETISFSVIGRRPDLIERLLHDAYTSVTQSEQDRLVIMTSWAGDWRPFGPPRRRRLMNSVILQAGVVEAILRDVRQFLGSAAWYEARGIPYRRGYLLHGPPGGGKSSFVHALASELGYRLCILSLSDGLMTDDRLLHLLNSLPDRCILLLEDIDCATSASNRNFNVKYEGGGNHLSTSGLLNALDGVAASEERIIFMTTNYIKRLDSALLRPGRCDFIQEIGYITEGEHLGRLFSRFYPDSQLANDFIARVFSKKDGSSQKDKEKLAISAAEVQGHFIKHRDNPAQAIHWWRLSTND